jgi:hypothetical protein
MADFTTTGLLSSVRDFGSFSDFDPDFTNAKLLNFMNFQLGTDVVPLIMTCREEYFVSQEDFELASQQTFEIPTKAIGAKVRDFTVWGNVGTDQETMIQSIPRLNPDFLDRSSGGFYVQNNTLKLYPKNLFNNNTARITFYYRPNDIVPLASAGRITDINGSIVTLNAVPATFTANTSVDGISNKSPYKTVVSTTITLVNVLDVTLSDVTDLVVGDYICLEGESVYAQIPQDFISYLIQATVLKALESKNDAQYSIALQKYNDLRKVILNLSSDRTEGENIKVAGFNKLSDSMDRWI